jgi:hypothetical protein
MLGFAEDVCRGRPASAVALSRHPTLTIIKSYVSRVLMKLGVRDRVQAVVLVYESGVRPDRTNLPPQAFRARRVAPPEHVDDPRARTPISRRRVEGVQIPRDAPGRRAPSESVGSVAIDTIGGKVSLARRLIAVRRFPSAV